MAGLVSCTVGAVANTQTRRGALPALRHPHLRPLAGPPPPLPSEAGEEDPTLESVGGTAGTDQARLDKALELAETYAVRSLTRFSRAPHGRPGLLRPIGPP
eukprot:1195431-Prorocentrum_minimum.AAC.8